MDLEFLYIDTGTRDYELNINDGYVTKMEMFDGKVYMTYSNGKHNVTNLDKCVSYTYREKGVYE